MQIGRLRPKGRMKTEINPAHRGPGWTWQVKNRTRPQYLWGWLTVRAAKAFSRLTGIPTATSALHLELVKEDGRIIQYGLVGQRVVTNAGVDAIVDAFQNSFAIETFNYHGIGTGSTAEAVGDTALVTELTTEYTPDNTRATGTQGENGTNVYQSVGTNTVDAAVALREHGLFSQAATGGGVLLDRTVFALINLGNGDSLQSTYELTVNAGG